MFNAIEQRRRQIDTLRTFNDKVETIADNEKYEIKFKSGKNKVTLLIELDQDFPYTSPKLSVIPNLSHPWIEKARIEKAPGILNFTINSDLGRVCQAIIREFEKNPPELAPIPQQPVKLQSSIPELLELQVEQLQALLNDDQYMDDFIEELTPIKSLNADLDVLIESNETIANENLEMKSKLDALKTAIEELSGEFINSGGKYEEINRRYVEKSQEYSPDHIKQLLQIAVSNAESLCDQYVENFLNGDDSLTQFLDNFMETKKLIATRKFKEERLNFQLNQLKL